MPFHVVVAKTAYAVGPCGADGYASLTPLDAPAPLYVQDRHHDDDVERSVRHESDLAPFKPACDVIVIGSGHAPRGRAASRFKVALRVQEPDRAAPLPERPHPLNPLQALSPRVYDDWQAALAHARRTRLPGRVLIDKTLIVTGPRSVLRRLAPWRLVQTLIRVVSLSIIQPNPYRLTSPKAVTQVPLRFEHAQGGQCRVDAGETAAKRVPRKHRLAPEQQKNYPSPALAPVAHDSSERNPCGSGFARAWFLRAARVASLPAPSIEYANARFSARRFWRAARGKIELVPAGFGYVGRGWLPRRNLIGTFADKQAWQPDEIPLLPHDFDFRYWNGAPDDQQCRHLEGGEHVTLTNLYPATSPCARVDARGNSEVRFSLPRQALFLIAADDTEAVAALPLSIDTVAIDLDANVVELVWRHCLVADGTFTDARLLHAATAEQLQRLAAWNRPADDTAASEKSPRPATAP